MTLPNPDCIAGKLFIQTTVRRSADYIGDQTIAESTRLIRVSKHVVSKKPQNQSSALTMLEINLYKLFNVQMIY